MNQLKLGSLTSKLISAILITIFLTYSMIRTPSPKIIFVPFLICSISMAGKCIALILDKKKIAVLFSKLFIVGFLLFWFGFLVVAFFISLRDKSYSLILFSLPFWLVGIYVVKNKLLNIESKNKEKSRFNFAMIIGGGLVIITMLAGLIILVMGVMERNTTIIFLGAFFTFGAGVFVLGALTVLGYFDKFKIDVLGIYTGVLFVAIGIGFIAIKYGETQSLLGTIRAFGLWILIPVMMFAVGVFQIVKCLKNKG